MRWHCWTSIVYVYIAAMTVTLLLLLVVLVMQAVAELQNGTQVKATRDGVPDMYWPDNSTIHNGNTFSYTINPSTLCSTQRPDVFLLAIVHTAPANLRRRMLIRQSWASQQLYETTKTVVVFAMGRASNAKLQTSIEREAAEFGDILQKDYEDSYKNLTHKAIMWLGWTSEYCKEAVYVLKLDDDIFVNIFNLVTHLSTLYKRHMGETNTCLCLVWYHMKVMRSVKNKWYVSPSDWPLETFPRYCSGSAFVLSADLIPRMYDNAKHTKFFWVDDFYTTGLLLAPLNVTYISLASLYVLKADEMRRRLVDEFAIFGHIPSSMSKRMELWREVLKARGVHEGTEEERTMLKQQHIM